MEAGFDLTTFNLYRPLEPQPLPRFVFVSKSLNNLQEASHLTVVLAEDAVVLQLVAPDLPLKELPASSLIEATKELLVPRRG